MLKKTLSALITVIMLFSALTSCSEVQKSNDATARAPFDENGNMLCDYYVLNVLINGIKPNAKDGYKYAVHRYQNIVDNSWKDLVTYGEKIEQTEHAIAIYTSFGTNEESISFEYYGVPRTAATALKMVLRSELKNSGVYSYDGLPYFCAEVVEIKKDRITVAPLDSTIEKYIADTLSVSTVTTGLGITADKLSVGDRIRIFYDGGVFKSGINIRGTDHFELLRSNEQGFSVSFLGLTLYKEASTFEGAANGNVFTNCSVPGALPAYVVTSASALAEQKNIISNTAYRSGGNFQYLKNNYSDEYFAQNALIIVYLPSPSASYNYDIETLTINDGKLTLKITETNSPPVPYPEKMLYGVILEVDSETAGSIRDFDVELIN